MLGTLIDGTFANGDTELFRGLYNSLLYAYHPDVYYIIADFQSYREAHKKIEELYRDRTGWAKKSLINIANSGKFSSDRVIEEYATEIWHLKKLV